jgi:hypothetical protein
VAAVSFSAALSLDGRSHEINRTVSTAAASAVRLPPNIHSGFGEAASTGLWCWRNGESNSSTFEQLERRHVVRIRNDGERLSMQRLLTAGQADMFSFEDPKPGFRWPVAVAMEIRAPAEQVWAAISLPGNLELYHPFCAKDPVHAWQGGRTSFVSCRMLPASGYCSTLRFASLVLPSGRKPWFRLKPTGATGRPTLSVEDSNPASEIGD